MTFNFWPGGIPEHIKQHPTPINWELLPNETKGWELFIEENWVVPDESDVAAASKAQQRRALVEQWALATQEFRDSYQSRVPPRYEVNPTDIEQKRNLHKEERKAQNATQEKFFRGDEHGIYHEFILAASMEIPRNRALWTKICILFCDLSGEIGTSVTPDEVSIAVNNPASGEPLNLETLMMWRYVEMADFNAMAMTSKGTVIFKSAPWTVFIDQKTLDTGFVSFCDFENNGKVGSNVPMWPMDICTEWPMVKGLGHGPHRFVERYNSRSKPPLKMELPILELLDDPHIEWWLHFEGDPDTFAEDIEVYAPGYLEMEKVGGGMVTDYDHDNFQDMS